MRSLDLGRPDIGEPITFFKCRWRKPCIFNGHHDHPIRLRNMPFAMYPSNFSHAFCHWGHREVLQVAMQVVVWRHIMRAMRAMRSGMPCSSSKSPHFARCRRSDPDVMSGPRVCSITVPCSGVHDLQSAVFSVPPRLHPKFVAPVTTHHNFTHSLSEESGSTCSRDNNIDFW